MGKHLHNLNDEPDGGSPTCECGCEAIIRQGRWHCPISWKNNHGMGRKEHRLSAVQGMVTCKCGAPCSQLPNGTWTCRATREAALRGIARQEAIVGVDEIEGARELGAVPNWNPDEVLTDEDIFDVVPIKPRAYPTYRELAKR